jgi:hypothetical protein
MDRASRGWLVCIAIALALISATSCRFQSPNASEGQHLVNTKVFPAKVPPWVMQSKDSPRQPVADAGLVPQSYSAPPIVKENAASVPNPVADTIEGKEIASTPATEEKAKAEKEKEKNPATLNPEESRKELSPLDRIALVCPGAESAVKDALQTAAVAARVQKYEKLTKRCPQSWDLWLWLGKDYESENKLAEAGRCYERVLTLDYENEVAQALLANVRRRQNSKPAQ